MDDNQVLSQALSRLRELKAEVARLSGSRVDGVAVIGCAMKFPGGVNSLADFEALLFSGRDTAAPIPEERWNAARYFSADRKAEGRLYAAAASLVDGIADFDPLFFGLSASKAIDMDPQHRLLLEIVWRALEDAGIAPKTLSGSRTGVYVGLSSEDYSHGSINSGDPTRITAFSTLGNARSIAAGRISYLLDLAGPCMQLDTACSSSLVGIHLARTALLSGEIDMAIVATANLIISPHGSIACSKLRAVSIDGRSKPFDARADGYGRGEGIAAVILKRATDATQDEDHVYGLIKGSAVNHDGRSNGLTAPNGSRQEAVIRDALREAKFDAESIQYVEAHGTGTPLGDPIEVISLGNVYSPRGTRDRRLLVGSVKGNVGHLEAAAGMAGLLKLLVVCKAGEVPPTANFQVPNPRIPWANYDLEVNDTTRALSTRVPIRVSVSAFGLSGTNCHVVMEQAPRAPEKMSSGTAGPHLLCISAQTKTALMVLLKHFRVLIDSDGCDLGEVCRSANVGRNHVGAA
ncbi:beta-ketoacyl synthase N-terminal-like domain-containing protein [Polaromonas sp. JS666]|uniref:beta-ketoacyl synthase N-terminal-like domain-containing protein n=1 Tax=Polaromonas sp. (strain JS666 / ATCC BAA-500) TaxID=296591 RepID=UPI000053428E|nr:polyketide synthase [Polaromonas sp. JS666]ABE47179.1 beta-ketoacyl synthase [Polaromonas sp. JS666]